MGNLFKDNLAKFHKNCIFLHFTPTPIAVGSGPSIFFATIFFHTYIVFLSLHTGPSLLHAAHLTEHIAHGFLWSLTPFFPPTMLLLILSFHPPRLRACGYHKTLLRLLILLASHYGTWDKHDHCVVTSVIVRGYIAWVEQGAHTSLCLYGITTCFSFVDARTLARLTGLLQVEFPFLLLLHYLKSHAKAKR